MSHSKLRWRCRRGTRELDVVLTRFLDDTYPGLSATEQALFASLLDQQDPDLAAWILAGEPAPPQWRDIVARVRGMISESGENLKGRAKGSLAPAGGEGQGEGTNNH